MPYGSADSEQSMQKEIDSLKRENAALKAELAQLSHNTGSTKLLDELRQLCDLAKHLTRKNRLRCYEIIEQLQATRRSASV